MMRALAALLISSLCLHADTYPRQNGVDALHYIFRVTIPETDLEISGEATADVRFLTAGVTTFTLDLASPTAGKGMTVSAVTTGTPATPLRFTHQNDRLVITLATPSQPNERRQFTVTYRGIPASGLAASKNAHGDRGIFSANWPNLAHQWLPIIDHPYDKATSEFLITAPVKYQVVANGLLQETRDLGDGRRLTHWKQDQPIASWLNAIGVAELSVRTFARIKDLELQAWVPYQDRTPGIDTFDLPTRQALEFLSEFVGPFPYDKLANIWAWYPGFGGGTEHASAIFYSCCKTSPQVVWHEIAHQWFGDAITESDWDHVWLSESFATYFTHLTREHVEGRDAFVAGLQADIPRIFAAETKFPGENIIHNNLADMARVLQPGAIYYQKGGWVLHMLRHQLGTDKFRAGIQQYYRLYRDKNATSADFQRVMEETSGQQLDWFFRQWLHRSASPALDGSWKYNAATKKVEIDLTQRQPGDPYRLPLEVAVGKTLSTLEFTAKQQHFAIAADSEPATVVLDPNSWTLMDTPRFARK